MASIAAVVGAVRGARQGRLGIGRDALLDMGELHNVNDDGPGLCAAGFVVCAVFGLWVCAYEVLTGDDARGSHLGRFADAAGAWMAHGHPALVASGNWTVLVGNTKYPLQPVTSDELDWLASDAEHGAGAVPYTALHFETCVPIEAVENSTSIKPFIFRTSHSRIDVDLPLSHDTQTPVHTFRSKNHHKQHEVHAVHVDTCHAAWRLSGLCIQVQPTTGNVWTTAPRIHRDPQTFGCHTKGHWQPGIYKRWAPSSAPFCKGQSDLASGTAAPSTVTDDLIESGSCDESSIPFVVRSSGDPILTAEELTRGSLDFGRDAGSQITLGLVLVFLGGVLLLVPAQRLQEFLRSEEANDDSLLRG